MQTNKAKALEAALKLFNVNGIVNVRLQHISDEAIVSLGNLAYHFPNKAALVMELFAELSKKQRELLAEYRTVPLFEYMDRLFRQTFALQQAYIFFYLDTLEIIRAYPGIASLHRQHIEWQVAQLHAMIEFNAARGALAAEPVKGIFRQLAGQVRMTADLWLANQAISGGQMDEIEAYLEALWALFMPYFTQVGQMEYDQMKKLPPGIFT